jgi:hypothetical protein
MADAPEFGEPREIGTWWTQLVGGEPVKLERLLDEDGIFVVPVDGLYRIWAEPSP